MSVLLATAGGSSGLSGLSGLSVMDAPPFLDALWRVVSLHEYNTRLVVLSTAILGAASGTFGTFLLLRKRALIGDALSHAMLPGIALAFMAMVGAGAEGKSLAGLLAGAALFGLAGVGCVVLITRMTRLKDDAALGIVLSVFFGLGIALLGLVQRMPEGSQAGLQTFIYGKTASIVKNDLIVISIVALACVLVCVLLFKELRLLSFDEGFARAQGWPTTLIDVALLALVTAITVIGLQAVGLILMVAFLIIPAAAARFWTERLAGMTIGAAGIGAASGWLGATLSALYSKVPAGAVIVVVAAGFFVASLLFGARRGALPRLVQHHRLARRIRRHHLLRALWEVAEARGPDVSFGALLARRSWSPLALRRGLASLRRGDLVEPRGRELFRLTAAGEVEAAKVVRNHRLWELYLVTYADVAPSHVDRAADEVEHILGPELVAKLEAIIEVARVRDRDRDRDRGGAMEAVVPESPHLLT